MTNAAARTAAHQARRSESARGIAFMLAGMFLFSAVDAQTKYLVQELPALQVAWARQSGMIVPILFILVLRGRGLLRTARPLLQLLRALLAISSSILFIFSVRFVPLADAVAVSFVAPLAVTILGAIFLGEPVGLRRWTAVAVGFAGAMIVVRPGLGVIHPAALLVLIASTMFAGRQVITRLLSDSDDIITTMAFSAIAGAVLLALPLPFVWQAPDSGLQVLLMASIAAGAAAGEFLVIKALQVAQAVVVAPVQYTMLLWGTGYGYLVFGDLPDHWTLIGSAIIIGSGVYTFYRERRLAAAGQRTLARARRPGHV
ncbi:MAG: DMT family transporter [Alphaproteobacteria bacterium]